MCMTNGKKFVLIGLAALMVMTIVAPVQAGLIQGKVLPANVAEVEKAIPLGDQTGKTPPKLLGQLVIFCNQKSAYSYDPITVKVTGKPTLPKDFKGMITVKLIFNKAFVGSALAVDDGTGTGTFYATITAPSVKESTFYSIQAFADGYNPSNTQSILILPRIIVDNPTKL